MRGLLRTCREADLPIILRAVVNKVTPGVSAIGAQGERSKINSESDIKRGSREYAYGSSDPKICLYLKGLLLATWCREQYRLTIFIE